MQMYQKAVAAGLGGAALAMSGGLATMAIPDAQVAYADAATEQAVFGVDGYEVQVALPADSDAPYLPVSNVEGTFTFVQDGVTPSDELFNIFGTAITSLCSKPAVEVATDMVGSATYYINVGGSMEKSFVVDLAEMDGQSVTATIACSCATGSPFGQASVVGIPLEAIVSMADLEEGANTVTAFGADGYGEALPLQYALDHHALLVYEVNGEPLTSEATSAAQLWMPSTVARYFTRNVVSLEFGTADELPEVIGVEPTYRNKVMVFNEASDVFSLGDELVFAGVADDCGSPIVAIEFTFDGGNTWTVCETPDATSDKWVNWEFSTRFEEAGDYRLEVRARTADGVTSPVYAALDFTVA